ncbi:hypothetical protein OPIT5_03630 [Opitutaceae bacterium TAV5]|nr:hypothetical protein OPIT5_03630 [Opitutaceae bacterium TAV5]
MDYEAVALADALGVDVADLFRKIDCPKNLLRRRAG